MKLWIFLECPRCGFHGCAVPFDEAPCPQCGFAQTTEQTVKPISKAS
jgi:hypothetical protein